MSDEEVSAEMVTDQSRVLTGIVSLSMTGVVLAGECAEKTVELIEATDRSAGFEVFELCKSEAELGDAESTFYLANFYNGLLSPDDFDGDTVAELVETSAEMGFTAAQFWIGWYLENGLYVPRDHDSAISWYEKAAESGYSMALDRLEQAYRNGELGLEIDVEAADRYRALADE